MNKAMLAALTLLPLLAPPAVQAQASRDPSSQVRAGDLPCSGTISGRTINGDVTVPRGLSCTLVNTRVNGDVEVERGASLTVRNTRIDGDLETEDGFARIGVASSVVNGDIEAEKGGSVNVEDVRVSGDIQLRENTGTLRIARVTVNGDLECEDNRRAPTGGRNQIGGDREGQCRDL